MQDKINLLEQKLDALTKTNAELLAFKQEYFSAKQSLNRMSARLRKLCKKLTPTDENVEEMQKISIEIREFVKLVT